VSEASQPGLHLVFVGFAGCDLLRKALQGLRVGRLAEVHQLRGDGVPVAQDRVGSKLADGNHAYQCGFGFRGQFTGAVLGRESLEPALDDGPQHFGQLFQLVFCLRHALSSTRVCYLAESSSARLQIRPVVLQDARLDPYS
jgi:hypothetical protein